MSLDEQFTVFPTMETKRLLLRPMEAEDAAAHFSFFPDPVLQQGIRGGFIPQSVEQTRVIIENFFQAFARRSSITWGIALKENNQIIGGIDLTNFVNQRMADLGFYLTRRCWNQGFITEAVSQIVRFSFERAELNRLQATAAVENIASIRVLQKTGFTQEGLLREYAMGSEFGDVYMFSILRREYRAGS
jgi:ribosomal-protein-alanine N-acetyltransferase